MNFAFEFKLRSIAKPEFLFIIILFINKATTGDGIMQLNKGLKKELIPFFNLTNYTVLYYTLPNLYSYLNIINHEKEIYISSIIAFLFSTKGFIGITGLNRNGNRYPEAETVCALRSASILWRRIESVLYFLLKSPIT